MNKKEEKILKQELEKEELDNQQEIKNKIKERRSKRKISKIIGNIILTIIFLFLIFEAAIGIINMQRIDAEKKPVWYLSTKKTETALKTETTYNLGLYKIIKTDTSKKTTITLRPFFMNN